MPKFCTCFSQFSFCNSKNNSMDEKDTSSTKSKEKKYLIQEKKSQILLKPVEKEKSWLDVLIERDRTFIQKRIAQIGQLIFS